MNTQTKVRKFKTYSDYSKQWLIDNHIKIKSVTVKGGNYNPHFVYLSRVAQNNPKFNSKSFRVLINGIDKVQNCIMITFDTEKVDKNYIEYQLKSAQRLINQWANGTCQRFINQDIIAQVLSGAVNNNGKMNGSVLY